MGSIPGLGSSPGEGNGNPRQYSCLENPMDGRAWQATVHGVTKSWTRLSYFLSFFFLNVVLWQTCPRVVQTLLREEFSSESFYMDIFEQLYFTKEQIFFIDFLIKIYFLLDYYTHVFLSFFFFNIHLFLDVDPHFYLEKQNQFSDDSISLHRG